MCLVSLQVPFKATHPPLIYLPPHSAPGAWERYAGRAHLRSLVVTPPWSVHTAALLDTRRNKEPAAGEAQWRAVSLPAYRASQASQQAQVHVETVGALLCTTEPS